MVGNLHNLRYDDETAFVAKLGLTPLINIDLVSESVSERVSESVSE